MMGIKKTSSIKNKFFEPKHISRNDEKIPHPEDQEMGVEEEKDTFDYDMRIDEDMQTGEEMEIDVVAPSSQTFTYEEDCMEDRDPLQDAKSKRADRRKTILKELEVCDLLDL